jgi:transposase
MYGWEPRVLLRQYLDQGLSKTAIADRLGLTRRTIQRWIAAGELDRDLDAEPVRYRPRPPVVVKLDPFKSLITTRLSEFPELTAVRLFDEVRAAGYSGGLTQLKAFVRRVRPAPPAEAVQRFETPPGRQAQIDFARFRLPWGVRYALLVVLGYSRLLWLRFYARQDMATLFTGLEAAFAYLGGVPHELLFDQMRAIVLRDLRLAGGGVIENAEFRRFAAHWGFRARACRPYRARTKGKVERPIRYLRQSFFYGRTFISDADLNAQAERWLERVANRRLHQTTKARPIDRFEAEERALLQPLAPRPYHSLVLAGAFRASVPASSTTAALPVTVEQRPLAAYAQLVGGGA